MYPTKELFHALLIFIASFAVFRLSPIHTVFDSRYEILFSQQLLRNHSFSLDSRAVLNGVAAVSTSVWWWNVRPTNIDEDVKRLWDWRHPQFANAFQPNEGPMTSPSP